MAGQILETINEVVSVSQRYEAVKVEEQATPAASGFSIVSGSTSFGFGEQRPKTTSKSKLFSNNDSGGFGGFGLQKRNETNASLFGSASQNASDSTDRSKAKAFGFGSSNPVEEKNVPGLGGGFFGRSSFGSASLNASDSTNGKKANTFGGAFSGGSGFFSATK
ncbi:1114_t:CDS:2 [Paraglomus brasilianum]|uniref:1114_t:CDS:1 n=1 Tax=Paraglomus brasilianum TaxID=144538 RepID=A0A9N9CY91_9GLOM|nr:1114_t:CDS:2 [Paraglomus brasilianum]